MNLFLRNLKVCAEMMLIAIGGFILLAFGLFFGKIVLDWLWFVGSNSKEAQGIAAIIMFTILLAIVATISEMDLGEKTK